LIGSIAAVVGVGAVIGIAVGVMSKKADTDQEPAKTDVTVNETSEQTEDGVTSETGNTVDAAATPAALNITGEEMREITEDDLVVAINDVTYNRDQMIQHIYCYVWNGSIKPGDEIKLIGRTLTRGEDAYLTVGTMTDQYRNPITEANEGDFFCLDFTGDEVNLEVSMDRTIVYADSDIEPARGVKVRVTFEPGFDYNPNNQGYTCYFGDFSARCSESMMNTVTLIERDGDDVILYFEFERDCSYVTYPGFPCLVRSGGQTVAKGEVVTVYQ
jgi:hypothetical protein